jgi:copper chaperone
MKLKVEGMTCQHCVRAVSAALEHVPGVEKVTVHLDRGEALVEGLADVQDLVKAVREEGYEAKG